MQVYSHLNGLEYLKVHKPSLGEEIQSVVEAVDAEIYRIKVSKEKQRRDGYCIARSVGTPNLSDCCV